MSPATPRFERIAFVASPNPEAREAFERLAAGVRKVMTAASDQQVASMSA